LRASRPWLAVVLILFCLPLFIGLGRLDLETDEAIYSFAVDKILEVGHWLEPRSSPSETEVFLEKPPLKFWIVAAPLKLGVLPHDEFGLRFWDALSGGVAFVYVFLIGSLLAGPVCGTVAVFLLFVHGPLVFQHGLRTNNMEAMLVLSYSGGVYHFLRWGRAEGLTARRGHAIAAGLFFVVAFMTKFVAALFLPLVLGICVLSARSYRLRLVREWRLWIGVAVLILVLILPWFVYAQVRFGRLLWDTILGAHVLVRFTGTLIPEHRQPWNFYFLSIHREFGRAGWVVVAGLAILLVQAIRRRSAELAVIFLWATLPLALISLGTSKLYHYAYPFLPPLALAAGYLIALFVMLAPVPLRNGLQWIEDRLARASSLRAMVTRPPVSALLRCAILLAAAAALAVAVSGRIRLPLPGGGVLRSSGLIRPLVAMVVCGVLARRSAGVSRLVAAILAVSVIPVGAYYTTIPRLLETKAPLRNTSQCVERIQAKHIEPPGLYVNRAAESWWHPLYYYFRRIQPWIQSTAESTDLLNRYLYDPAEWRPVLIDEEYYRRFIHAGGSGVRPAGTSPALVTVYDTIVLLPGPYAACSPEAALRITP
jgi:4-amino-4-deoxy-L-arabinose transferase-like glycosyltransferase